MGCIEQARALADDRPVCNFLLLGDIEQFVFDAQRAVAGIGHAADDQIVLFQQAPGRELDFGLPRREFDDVVPG